MEMIYLGLGANLGDPYETLCRAAEAILKIPRLSQVRFSRLYRTSPVSSWPQPDFLNAACSFMIDWQPLELFEVLTEIEKKLGKLPKSKEAPRHLDIDIIFYGSQCFETETLIIPHPRWKERLFVLYPLKDLTSKIFLEKEIDLQSLIDLHDHEQQKIEVYNRYLLT